MDNVKVRPGSELEMINSLWRLRSDCVRWLKAWTGLPTILYTAECRLREVSEEGGDLATRSRAIMAETEAVFERCAAGLLQPTDLNAFEDRLLNLVDHEQRQPDWRNAGSLYSTLHIIKNHVEVLVRDPRDILDRARKYRENTNGLANGRGEQVGQALEQLLTAMEARVPAQVAAAETVFQSALPPLPPPAPRARSGLLPRGGARNWIIVGVEDIDHWQSTITDAAHRLAARLAPEYQVACETYGDREAAERRLRALTRREVATGRPDPANPQPVVVLDMSIPRRAGEGASRDEGLALLKTARHARVNAPVIVMATAVDFRHDYVEATTRGVEDYLSKDGECGAELEQCLERIITSQPRRRHTLLEHAQRLIKVDDVEVSLPPPAFRIFKFLADRAPEAYTVDEIALHLDGEVTPPDTVADNIRRAWARANEEGPGGTRAVLWARSEWSYDLWKTVRMKLGEAGVDAQDDAAVAAFLNQCYFTPPEGPPSVDPERIPDHVHDIRRAVREAFNAVGKHIVSEEEVLVTTHQGDHLAYKVVSIEQATRAGRRARDERAFRVLVVEDNIELWQKPVRALLERHGYEVQGACCEAEAIAVANTFRPHVLCLDMQLPPDLEAFQRGYAQSAVGAGLRVLEAVRVTFPAVRAVALTDFAHKAELLEGAARLGLRPQDFVDKKPDPERPWDAELLLRVWRIEQEVRRQALLPLPTLPRLPYIRLQRSRRSERDVEVNGSRWSATPQELQLLWLLAERGNYPVATEEIVETIWGPGANPKRLTTLVATFRGSIQKDWYHLADGTEGKLVREAVIANDAKAGYLLNARVVIEE